MEIIFLILLALLVAGIFSIAGGLARIAEVNEKWLEAETNTRSPETPAAPEAL